MANTIDFLENRFFAISGIGKIQPDKDTPMLDEDIDTRHNCTLTLEDVVERRDDRDCEDVDLVDQPVQTRYKRLRLNYQRITPQQKAVWWAYYLGQAIAPVGTSQNEVQLLERSGTVDGGTFRLGLDLEGFDQQTVHIPYDATPTEIARYLTASRMRFIQPGDFLVEGGRQQQLTLIVAGTANETGDLPVTVLIPGHPVLGDTGKTIQVPIEDLDTAAQVAGKIRAAFIADADIGHPVTGSLAISGADENVIATFKQAAANVAGAEISYTSVLGMTGASSTVTVTGVDPDSWEAGIRVTFQNRLGNAPMPLLTIDNTEITGGGEIEISRVQAGSNVYHEFGRSLSREKVRFGFALGALDESTDPVKYSGFVVESVNPQAARRQAVVFEVSIVGLFDGEEMTGYTIPDCIQHPALESGDCRLQVNGGWETPDISTLAAPFDDQVPLDESAYGFVGIDPDLLARSRQIIYNVNAQIFCTEADPIAQLAVNERTQSPVDMKVHFGMPGNRLSLLMPATKVKFQSGERFSFVGAAERSAGNFELTGFKNDQAPPVSAEAYLDQTQAFLQVSELP